MTKDENVTTLIHKDTRLDPEKLKQWNADKFEKLGACVDDQVMMELDLIVDSVDKEISAIHKNEPRKTEDNNECKQLELMIAMKNNDNSMECNITDNNTDTTKQVENRTVDQSDATGDDQELMNQELLVESYNDSPNDPGTFVDENIETISMQNILEVDNEPCVYMQNMSDVMAMKQESAVYDSSESEGENELEFEEEDDDELKSESSCVEIITSSEGELEQEDHVSSPDSEENSFNSNEGEYSTHSPEEDDDEQAAGTSGEENGVGINGEDDDSGDCVEIIDEDECGDEADYDECSHDGDGVGQLDGTYDSGSGDETAPRTEKGQPTVLTVSY